jgi:predicted membrane-bound spermidine synthase
MYHVIGTGITAIILYLISYFFYRIEYYSLAFHRKLWNTLLAFSFMLTASAGVFMALQVTYKWDIPFVKSILKWHVEFGIGMAITGILHFIWHLSYFRKIFHHDGNFIQNRNFESHNSSEIKTNLFIIGFVSTAVQLLLIREVINIAGGYELIAGIFLGSWLILSAAGAAIAGKSPLIDIKKINLVFSLSPVLSLLLLFIFSRLFLNTGETPTTLVSIVFTFIVLIPLGIVSGFTFTRLMHAAGNYNDSIPGISFSIETTGGIISGILISALTSGILNTYQTLLLIILISIAYTLLTFYILNNNSKNIFRVIIVLLSGCLVFFNTDIIFRQILLPGIKVVDSKDTPYGNITQGKYNGEQSIYYNQRLLTYNDDLIEREENIHYAMLQSKLPEKVILISGSLRNNLPELLKYPVKKITYIERDPLLAMIEKSYTYPNSDNLVIENADAFSYIRKKGELADVIILLAPPPSTLLLNRYYTTEFFSYIKKRLNASGVFMCSPGPGDEYLNKESINLYSSIYNSLQREFKNVKPVIGNKLYLISSDGELSVSFCQLAGMKNIKNTYVSSDYLNDELITKKTEDVNLLLNRSFRQNTSAFPIGCFHFQSYFLSSNPDEKTPAIILMLMLFAMPALAIKRRNLLMYFSALTLAGFEIIILITLQLVVGNMFQLTGLVIAGIMSGLATGAGFKMLFLRKISVRFQVLVIMAYYLVFGLLYNYIITLESGLPAIVLIIFSVFIPALFTGRLFRELTRTSEGQIATSAIYSSDLAGSALGFIVMTGIAVPSFGIQVSVFILSGLIFAGFLLATISNK